MTIFIIILKGLLIGFSIAAPVGPIAFLCIRTTLKYGRTAGLAIGAGAASADTVYAALGIFSLSFIKAFIMVYAFPLRIIGGIFLLGLGAMTIWSKMDGQHGLAVSRGALFKKFSTTFFLTLTNPATIFAFIAAFTAFGFHSENHFYDLILVLSVFSGSLLWWLVLAFSIAGLKQKINEENLRRINTISGLVITAFGLVAMISSLWVF